MLTFTVHLLLKGLANSRLNVGDLDPCLELMIEVSYLNKQKGMYEKVVEDLPPNPSLHP